MDEGCCAASADAHGWLMLSERVRLMAGQVESAAQVFLDGVADGIRAMVAEEVAAHLGELTAAVLKEMPERLVLPQFQQEVFPLRLLSLDEVAFMLGCSKPTVERLMYVGELAYIVPSGGGHRKVPYAWVVEYICKHKRFTGPVGARREVSEEASAGASKGA